jgi:hypothetical protein
MNFLKAAALISVILVASYVALTWPSVRPKVATATAQQEPVRSIQPVQPPPPKETSRTVAFMPGQYVNISNRGFRKVEIHSEYPIRVASGSCHLDYGVEFFCNDDPADIFITDMRPKPIFTTPKGNLITLTMIEF